MSDPYFPDVGVAVYARKLKVASDALSLLDEVRTKLTAIELNDLADEVEKLRLKVLKAVREVLPA